MYRNAHREGPSHRHRQQAQKFGEDRPRGFQVVSGQTYRQTD